MGALGITYSVPTDGKSLPRGMVSVFDRKYKEMPDKPARQTNSAPEQTNSSCRQQKFIFNLKDLFFAMSKVNDGHGRDYVHSNHLKLAGPVFRIL